MFDSVVTGHRRATRRDAVPLAISWGVHAVAIGAVAAVPLLYATDRLPRAPETIAAFVVTAPPPPPPPAAPAAAKPVTPRQTRAPRPVPDPPTVAPSVVVPAPVAPPAEIGPEANGVAFSDGEGGGVEGGLPGGVAGGVLGGVPDAPPPPPPPSDPIRTGGAIRAPSLVKQVPPLYPPVAVRAGVEGTVILEAVVGRDGRVDEVRVLRSVALLDQAAMDAVRQWEYAPLMLNNRAERFILTVTVSFSLSRA